MSGAISPLPNTPSWRCDQLKESTGTTLLTLLMVSLYSRYSNQGYIEYEARVLTGMKATYTQ